MTTLMDRRTVRGWELRHGIEQFAQQTAAHLNLRGIQVVWQPITTAAINGSGTMILAAVKDDAVINRATLVRYVGFVLHELLHRKYSRFDVNGDTDYLRRLHNAVEDAWIERRAIAQGLTGNIKGVLTELVQQIVNESLTNAKDWADPSVYPFALAVYARGYGIDVPLAQGLEPIFAEASARIDKAKSSTDTLQIAEWVFKQLNQLPERQPEQGKQDGDQSEQPEQGDGQNEAQGEGDAQGDAQGEQSQQSQGGQSQGGQGKQPGQATAPAPGQQSIEVEPTLPAADWGNVGTYWNGAGVTLPGKHLDEQPVRDLSQRAVPGRLRHEVRRIFENSAMTMFTRNRKAGAINVHALSRAGVTDRVFQQRRDVEGIDSSVVICLDVSSSMFGNMDTLASVGAMLTDTLLAAQVQTAIVSFGTYASLVSNFGQPAQKVRHALSRLKRGGDTNDYAAVRMAADMLLPRSEERKVIFVVTDGKGSPVQCKEQCRAAQALGITVIGIGIQENVGDVYPNAVRINSVEDLGGVVFSQIKIAA